MQKFFTAEVLLGETPLDEADGGYHGQYENLPGNIVNFFNPDDYALSTGTIGLGLLGVHWEQNHVVTKPSSFLRDPVTGIVYGRAWHYDPDTRASSREFLEVTSPVADKDEIRSMITRTRSKPVGSSAGVRGAVDADVDVKAQFGFGLPLEDHTAQCNRNIQLVRGYFVLMKNLFDTQ